MAGGAEFGAIWNDRWWMTMRMMSAHCGDGGDKPNESDGK